MEKCNDVKLIAAREGSAAADECDDGTSKFSGCATDHCIVLPLPGGKQYNYFVTIRRLEAESILTGTHTQCDQDLCVARCTDLTLLAARKA